MKLSNTLKRGLKLTTDNSPVVLTAMGVVGTVSTAWLTGKASFRAAMRIADEEERRFMHFKNTGEQNEPLTSREKFELVWTLYLPAVGSGMLTVAAIVGANYIGTKRAAALVAAYGLSERAFDEYKEKVHKHMGDNGERKVRDEIAKDHVRRNPPPDNIISASGDGNELFYDKFAERYFYSDVESVKKAMNDINYRVNNDFYASVEDFYDKLGLPCPEYAKEVGWNSSKLLEISFTLATSEDQRAVHVIDFATLPIREYFRTR